MSLEESICPRKSMSACIFRCLDLSGLSCLTRYEHIAAADRIFQACAPHLSRVSSLTLPDVKSPCWTACWAPKLPNLTSLHGSGCTVRSLRQDAQPPITHRLTSLSVRATCDASLPCATALSSLTSLDISFGKSGNCPTCAALTSALLACTALACLRFTFAQNFTVTQAVLEALGSLGMLEELEINSFATQHLSADCMSPLAGLSRLQVLELSGMNRVHNRCASAQQKNMLRRIN
jgi:hypothetical protein